MPKIGVILSGCGYLDGSEIHEATLTLYFLDKAGAEALVAAPDVPQKDVVGHIQGKPSGSENRNVLIEAARIARGQILPLKSLKASQIDGLILPGGFGAAKNLCDFAAQGPDCTVLPDLARLINELHKEQKPMGFICIAPAIAARVLGVHAIALTIGTDAITAKQLEKMGARHEPRQVDETCVDARHKIVSTPAYMLGPSISRVALGIEKLVLQILAMC